MLGFAGFKPKTSIPVIFRMWSKSYNLAHHFLKAEVVRSGYTIGDDLVSGNPTQEPNIGRGWAILNRGIVKKTVARITVNEVPVRQIPPFCSQATASLSCEKSPTCSRGDDEEKGGGTRKARSGRYRS